MTTVVRPLDHDLAVIAALETIGCPVGFAQAPDGALEGVRTATGPDYVVLWPLDVGDRSGPLDDRFADVEAVYQVTVVGRLPDGVRYLAAEVEQAMAAVGDPTGRKVLAVSVLSSGGVTPDDDLDPPVFVASPRFALSTTPA